MQRLGLALSGGGFRATIYHLGVVRFLRDAGILPRITHISSVSGGSVLGAHLVLHWDKYCGSAEEFDEVAAEIIRFTQMDVRNRIVRRFPMGSAVNRVRSLARLRTARQLTRAGYLEKYYERFLYGDIPLAQLPERPRLQILSTNLSEGCLCAFNRDGLLLQRRAPGRRERFERIQMGLATVPMAVAASSAFPGFFPPLEISGYDVGAYSGEYQTQAFTDGGVYDNLGLRIFRFMERSQVRESAPLRRQDFIELDGVIATLDKATEMPEQVPLHALREKLDQKLRQTDEQTGPHDLTDQMVQGLWEVIRSDELYRDPRFANLELSDSASQPLLNEISNSSRHVGLDDRIWLNRQIVESVLSQVLGKASMRPIRNGFDGVLVSDAGGNFKVTGGSRAGGLVSTALRSSDILMDRVRQLELEAFENTPGVCFFPITCVVKRSQDSTALGAEVQRQASRIRTDLDEFSDLEISTLIQHGYCVARTNYLAHANDLDSGIATAVPWDPLRKSAAGGRDIRPDAEVVTLQTARQLRRSSSRQIATKLLSLRDWPSYIWIAFALVLLVWVPSYIYQLHQRSVRQNMILAGVAAMNSDYGRILELIESEPAKNIPTLPFADVESMETPDYSGFEVLTDSRIFDLRSWSDPSGKTPASAYARLNIKRTEDGSGMPFLRLQRESVFEDSSLYSPQANLNPALTRLKNPDGTYKWELAFDFSEVPIGGRTELSLHRPVNSEIASTGTKQAHFNFSVRGKTGFLQVWLLLPEGRSYESFEVIAHSLDESAAAEIIIPYSSTTIALGSIATFRLINPEPRRYQCTWTWSD